LLHAWRKYEAIVAGVRGGRIYGDPWINRRVPSANDGPRAAGISQYRIRLDGHTVRLAEIHFWGFLSGHRIEFRKTSVAEVG
jgi:hypothetical protein